MNNAPSRWTDFQMEITVSSSDGSLEALESVISCLEQALTSELPSIRISIVKSEKSIRSVPDKSIRFIRRSYSSPKRRG